MSRALGAFIAGFKSVVTKQTNQLRGARGTPIWQRNYFEHIIRNEKQLNRMREYIDSTPLNWEKDQDFV